MNSILKITKLSKSFGGLSALRDISLEAEAGQIVGIIGPNGAGKTTLFNCLTGLYHPSRGEIIFQNHSILPEVSDNKVKIVHRCALVFLILSLIWAPFFWSFFLPGTYFKVELTLLTIFLLSIRLLLVRGLKQFQIWAWGLAFVFLTGDFYLSIWSLNHPSGLGYLGGSTFPLVYIAFPWLAFAAPFSLYFLWQLITQDVRQLFGFRIGPDAICRFGIARTFQNIRLFLNLSVLDNVKIGAHSRMKAGLRTTLLRSRSQRAEEERIEKQAIELLRFAGLENRIFDLAGSLAYGEQRRLEIARALASTPGLLLLDEPAAGMNPHESSRLIQLIRKICESGVTIIMIEHDMKVMMNLADIIYVFDHGVLIAHGTPKNIRENQKVIEAYLGRSGI